MDYKGLKQKFIAHKQEFVLAICFMLVFLVGFGAGRFEQQLRRDAALQSHYTTPAPKKASAQPAAPAPAAGEKVLAASSSQPCLIKGNISSGGKKVYHVAGGAFYKTVKPEQCFDTEAAAQTAGFVKSQR